MNRNVVTESARPKNPRTNMFLHDFPKIRKA